MKATTTLIYLISLLLYSNFAHATIDIQSKSNTSAVGTCDGSIDIVATGTAGPFTFQWSHGATTEDVSGLCSGNYSVTVTNAYGCERVLEEVIGEPLSLGTSQTIINRNCDGAQYCLQIIGGYGPYTYSWSHGAEVTTSCIQLSPGNYSVTITDASGQQVSTNCTIQGGNPIFLTSQTTPSCVGQGTGFIDLTVNGGTPPFSYIWSNGSTTEDVSNLAPGSYNVSVVDNIGCSKTAVFTVTDYNGFDLNEVVTEACADYNDGRVFLNPDGLAPFTYQWNTSATTTTSYPHLIHSLDENSTHQVTVTDATGCTQTGNFTIPEAYTQVSVDGEHCRYIKKCKNYEDALPSQWDPSTYQNLDKDNCEMTVYCPLTSQNETYSGQLVNSYKFSFPLAKDCFASTDVYCKEITRCDIYDPSIDAYIDPKVNTTSKTSYLFPAHTGIVNPIYGYTAPACYSNTTLVEVYCGPQQSNGENFIGYKCYKCSLFSWVSLQILTRDPDFCVKFPSECLFARPTEPSAPGIGTVSPNPFTDYFQLEFYTLTEDAEIIVQDALGRKVHTQQLEPYVGENLAIVTLDSSLPDGIYFVTLQSSKGLIATRRVIRLREK